LRLLTNPLRVVKLRYRKPNLLKRGIIVVWILVSLFLSKDLAGVICQVLLGVMVVIPIGYSFALFRRERSKAGYYDREPIH
jgi:hypothetical protein